MNDLIQRAVKRVRPEVGPSLIERAASRIAEERRVEGLGPRDPKSPSLADVELRGPRPVTDRPVGDRPGVDRPVTDRIPGASRSAEAPPLEAHKSVTIDFDRLEERGMVTPKSNRSL